jgi:hypothetical protein
VKRLADKPFVLLGINSDKDRQALRQTLIDERITWRSWWDDGRIDGPIHTTWQILQRPSIHILDAKGVIRFKGVQPEKVGDAINQLLMEFAESNKQ